jgi:NAD(P)-dependent dehydrogenase (short-subunit alcohol dehydrogenase family)
MNKRFAEKGTVVTGGGSGIGKATALRLAREGASVLVADVQEDKARETAEEIKKAGGQAEAFRVDLTRISEIDSLIREAVKLWGRLDILVNSAGLVKSQPFLEVTEADYDKIMDVNLKGTAFCVQKACAQMLAQIPPERRGLVASDRCNGKIVNLSSISGRRGRAYQLQYAASKAAIISLTQSAALAFAQYGINVNAICPSVVHTPMWEQNNADKAKSFGVDPKKESDEFISKIPMKRPGTAEEMAAAICFLCSPDADYITGQTLNVDGGFEMN